MRNGKIVLASGLALALSLTMTPAFSAPGRRSVARKVVVRPPVRRVVVVGSPWFGIWGPAFYPYGAYAFGGPSTADVRVQVVPKETEVFVDGYYAGTADDFDGVFQSLELEEGAYHIEIVAPGFAPLQFDVRIMPGRKITYRGDLPHSRP